MKIKKTPAAKKKPKQKRSIDSFYIIAAAVIVVIIGLFFLWHQKSFQSVVPGEGIYDKSLTEEISIPGETGQPETDTPSNTQVPAFAIDSPAAPEPVNTNGRIGDVQQSTTGIQAETHRTAGRDTNGSVSALPGDHPSPPISSTLNGEFSEQNTAPLINLCDISASTIKNFYSHLDTQDYMKSYKLEESSEIYFSKLIQRLIDNPPVVSGEMNDLFTILQNTAHFFRIIGKNNIGVLKGILDREKDQFEYVLADFYTLLHIPSCSDKSFSLSVPKKSLYDYSGFFLNTMGGRLYLFRRDSMSRMVVSYYAILLIDHANKNANNEHGIDIVSPINQLISDIESSSNTLLLREEYLDKLYSLKEEYQ